MTDQLTDRIKSSMNMQKNTTAVLQYIMKPTAEELILPAIQVLKHQPAIT